MSHSSPVDRARCVVEALRSVEVQPGRFVVHHAPKRILPLLVAVMLSQNTSDRNAIEAWGRLIQLLGGDFDARKLLSLPLEEVAEAIRPAGMHRVRAARIREAVARLLEVTRGDPDSICRMEPGEARRLLLSLPGVGPKTADVVLLNACGFPFFPVDTHISRVASRVGIGSKYEEIARVFGEAVGWEPSRLLEVHVKLIEVGRRWCKPRKPRCSECPLRRCCAFALSAASSSSAE